MTSRVVRCRLWERPGSERDLVLKAEDSPHRAPDQYVRQHVRLVQNGVAFVEVETPEGWDLWRVEATWVGPGGVCLFTHRTTPEEACCERPE